MGIKNFLKIVIFINFFVSNYVEGYGNYPQPSTMQFIVYKIERIPHVSY